MLPRRPLFWGVFLVWATTLILSSTALTSLSDVPPCLQGHDPGTCDKYVRYYFYDQNIQECRAFWYGGCGGNANRFKSCLECQKSCSPKVPCPHQASGPSTPVPERLISRQSKNLSFPVSDPCQFPEQRSLCLSRYVIKWFYNRTSGDCERFWYGGCHGSKVHFETNDACRARCRPNGKSMNFFLYLNLLFGSHCFFLKI